MEKRIFTSEGVCTSRIFFTLDVGKVVRARAYLARTSSLEPSKRDTTSLAARA